MRFECRDCRRDSDVKPNPCPCGSTRIGDKYRGLDGQGIIRTLDRCMQEIQSAESIALASTATTRPQILRELKSAEKAIERVIFHVGKAHPELAGALVRKAAEATASAASRTPS